MSYYMKRKGQLIEEALEFFDEQLTLSWEGLQIVTDYFEKYGRRYGLLREFRENGII